MKRIHVVGRKNSGKTTLIVDLVRHLTASGHRVGTIKHTHHAHELDTPGKDSFLHRQAGAAAVGIVSENMQAVFWPATGPHDDEQRYDRIVRTLGDCDLILVEGDTRTAWPKIEVWRAAVSAEPLARHDQSIVAVVTDDPLHLPVALWPRQDVPSVAQRLLRWPAK